MTAFFPPGLGGEGLEVEVPGHRDHADRQRAVDLGDERLEHPLRRDTQRVAGLQPVGAVPRVMVIGVHGVRHVQPGQQRGSGRSPSCHAPMIVRRPRPDRPTR
jgi:hypothetical protein